MKKAGLAEDASHLYVRSGNVRDQVIALADELKADVVIVGSRNPRDQTHLLGSEAANIVGAITPAENGCRTGRNYERYEEDVNRLPTTWRTNSTVFHEQPTQKSDISGPDLQKTYHCHCWFDCARRAAAASIW